MMDCINNSNLGNQAYFYPLLSPSRTRACVEKVKVSLSFVISLSSFYAAQETSATKLQ